MCVYRVDCFELCTYFYLNAFNVILHTNALLYIVLRIVCQVWSPGRLADHGFSANDPFNKQIHKQTSIKSHIWIKAAKRCNRQRRVKHRPERVNTYANEHCLLLLLINVDHSSVARCQQSCIKYALIQRCETRARAVPKGIELETVAH